MKVKCNVLIGKAEPCFCNGGSRSFRRAGGTYKLYTNNSYPRTSDGTNIKELINLYYDNYDFVDAAGISAPYFAYTQGVSDSEYNSAKGLQTGSRSALLDESGKYIYRHTRYDAFGRPVQMKSTNTIAGEMDFEFNKYNLTGQVIEKSIKTKTNSVSEKYAYNYDNQGRQQSTWYYLNNDPAKLMDSCTYDKFGRLLTKNTGGVNTTTYSYNVRSWQTKQEGTNLTEELFYTSCPRSDVTGMFGGNIIAKQWTTESSAMRGMYYAYDPLDRLISAGSSDGVNMTDNKNNYSEFSEYDKNGNFTSLMRSGRFDNGTFDAFDILLTSKYQGNRITAITDNGKDQTASDLMEFKAGSGQYAYDANGRLIADPYKKITNIEYNFVNLPRRIKFPSKFSSDIVEYIYDAMGTKFQAVYWLNSQAGGFIYIFLDYFKPEYAANKIYEAGKLIRILTQEGYVDVSGNAYNHYYYVKDYQGNNRMVLNSSGDIVQATNYYAYGSSYAEKPARDDQSVQPYKYNGKELYRMLGLDYYNNLARTYDPIVGRFTTPDPLAEKKPWLSLYCAFSDNPVNKIDPSGMDDYYTSGGQFIYRDNKKTDEIRIVNDYEKQLAKLTEKSAGKVDQQMLEKLSSVSIGKADLSAKSYSNIFTDVLSKMGDVDTKELFNKTVGVAEFDGNKLDADKIPTFKENYNTNIDDYTETASHQGVNFKSLVTASIVIGGIDDNRFLYSTVSNVQNLLGAHELLAHGMNMNNGRRNERNAYIFQMNHPSWLMTTEQYKAFINMVARKYLK